MDMKYSLSQCMSNFISTSSGLSHKPCKSSQDNAKFASSGGDRSVFLWDVASGTTTRRIAAHMSKIHVVEFNQDATVLASGNSPS